MLKRFVKFICVILCIAMLVPFTAVAEGQMEYNASVVPKNQPKTEHIDITDGSWYANNCRYVYNTNLMIGTSENQFSPHIEMTREMAVVTVVKAILCYVNYGNKNYANNSYKNNANNSYKYSFYVVPEYSTLYFKDVEPQKWYSNSIQWAYEMGIIDGIGDGYFGLGQPVTRQDFLTMLYNAIDLENYAKDIPSYEGDEDISDYARDAAGFFISAPGYVDSYFNYLEVSSVPSIIRGYPDGLYHFKDTITRAEAAYMLSLYIYRPYDTSYIFNYSLKMSFHLYLSKEYS